MIQGEMPRDTAKAETKFLLGRIGDSMAKRAPQARAVHEYIEGHRQYPMIVCGDFNDTPISYARHTIAQGLTDCYVETGNGPGLSYNLQGFYFRIDHMFVSDHFTPYGCKVDSKIDVSDHYPIVCTLKKADKP
jgi:endonuclease/exonuclease/phosphatase (EEP) superfamily protein YafD